MPFGTTTLNDGNKIPQIGFGSGSVNKGKDITPYILNAIHAGFSHIDTAQAYANEESVGHALRESAVERKDVWITTKFWPTGGGVRETLVKSLEKMGTSYVDLYLIHSPKYVPGDDVVATWSEFEKVRKEGLARSIGVSNFTLEDLRLLMKHAKIIPAVNQIYLSPYTLAENEELLDYCAKHHIVVEAYSSLSPITQFPGGPVDEPIHEAADRLGATPAQVIFAWLKSKGVVIITTTSQPTRLDEYLNAGDLAPLTKEEVTAIDKAGASWKGRLRILDHLRMMVKTTPARAKVIVGVTLLVVIATRLLPWH